MRTIEIHIYMFDELNEEAQQTALDSLRGINIDQKWYEDIYEDFIRICCILGIETQEKNISFSGFDSQGDGASFTGKYEYAKKCVRKIKEYAPQDTELHDIARMLSEGQKQHFYQLKAVIPRYSSHYCHSRTMSVEFPNGDDRDISDAVNLITDGLRQLADWLYKKLEKEYEYLTSDKAIIETINANDYEFTVEGIQWVKS